VRDKRIGEPKASRAASELAILMSRYCDGDAAAFRQLYDRVAARLLHHATCMMGDRASGEDVLQRAFLKVHRARNAYVRGADPMPWLYTIVRRVALDEVGKRRRARATLVEARIEESHAALDGDPDESADREALAALSQQTLAALSELTPVQRDALVLIKLHGRSVAEAALITGSSKSAVKVRAHRGLLTLRKLLGVGEADR
jgi:RNA polymerase sigma-70 factor (ECF subfamily)